MTNTIRAVSPQEDDRVVAAIVSSTLFEPDDAEMLAPLLADHHAGGGDRQRWLVDVEDGEITGTVMYRPIDAADRAWDLTLIAVSADRQGAGGRPTPDGPRRTRTVG